MCVCTSVFVRNKSNSVRTFCIMVNHLCSRFISIRTQLFEIFTSFLLQLVYYDHVLRGFIPLGCAISQAVQRDLSGHHLLIYIISYC